jgi:carbon storage regulator
VLVLSRRTGESIVIGTDIVVTVLDVKGDQVRIGIAAPREVRVHREELVRQLEAENTGAAGSSERARALVARLPAGARRPEGLARRQGMPPRLGGTRRPDGPGDDDAGSPPSS